MNKSDTSRRMLLRSLAAMPAAALVLRPDIALAATSKMIVFKGSAFIAGGKIEVQTSAGPLKRRMVGPAP